MSLVCRVLRLEPNGGLQAVDIPDTLEALQAQVGGDIEAVIAPALKTAGVVAYCNELGAGWPETLVSEGHVYRGPIVFTGLTPAGASRSLTRNQEKLIRTWIKDRVVRSW